MGGGAHKIWSTLCWEKAREGLGRVRAAKREVMEGMDGVAHKMLGSAHLLGNFLAQPAHFGDSWYK